MKTAIMQPYFLPYIGYWQLLAAVDIFVIYDNIQYTKKGWFNRNRFLLNSQDALFSISLKRDFDQLNVNERFISTDFDRNKLIAQFRNTYAKAPYFKDSMSLLREIISCNENNLFEYIFNSIKLICDYLSINTEIVISSKVDINHSLKGKNKVIEICKALKTTAYINPIGGQELYDKKEFQENNIDLKFIQSKSIIYPQFSNEFIPCLSIVDILMFNDKDAVKNLLNEYQLI